MMLMTESKRFILTQSDFLVNVKGQINKGTQMVKRTGIDSTGITDFTGRYELVHK